MTDVLDDAQTPRCPECGAVLRDAGPGYACRSCRIVVIGSIPSI
jgi:tRNA(Ile2) C34 agmatinyltransferase TiaS